MLIDKNTLLASAYAPTSTGTTYSDVLDLGVARDISGGVTDWLKLLVQVVTTFTSGGSATLKVTVETSADNSSWTILAQSDAVAVASLVAGYKFFENALPGPTSRYLRVGFVIATAAMTAGAITAALVPSLDVQPAYPRGYAA